MCPFQCQIRLTLKEGDRCKVTSWKVFRALKVVFQRSSDTCPEPARGKRAATANTTTIASPDDQEVDVYSQSMTVFELDDPISNRHRTDI